MVYYTTYDHYVFIDATCLYIWTFAHKFVLYGYNYVIEFNICYFPFVVKFLKFVAFGADVLFCFKFAIYFCLKAGHCRTNFVPSAIPQIQITNN